MCKSFRLDKPIDLRFMWMDMIAYVCCFISSMFFPKNLGLLQSKILEFWLQPAFQYIHHLGWIQLSGPNTNKYIGFDIFWWIQVQIFLDEHVFANTNSNIFHLIFMDKYGYIQVYQKWANMNTNTFIQTDIWKYEYQI